MSLPLEDLEYQRRAVAAVVGVFEGQSPNTFDNANFFGIQSNLTDLSPEQLDANKRRIIADNGIPPEDARLSPEPDLCIEMETGTGKTLVYLRTIYELHRRYGMTKFIILVPSIAIREGVRNAFANFREPLNALYPGTRSDPPFTYDSSQLSRLRQFIEDTGLQIMVATIQAVVGEDRIINQTGRDDSFLGLSYLQALGECRPVLIMDEPQEGMDTPAAQAHVATLRPLLVVRYSATHKVIRNLLYRLTPFDAYRDGLVKKIEVLSVAEKHDEATLKIEFADVKTSAKGAPPQARLRLWRQAADGFKWKESNWLKPGDNLGEKSGNLSYRDYTIERVWRDLRGDDPRFRLKFTNGVELLQRERAADHAALFRQQLGFLIERHFQKRPILAARGIKCLSLVFIDRVDSYVRDDGIIRRLFAEEYRRLYPTFHAGAVPTEAAVIDAQGYYFARSPAGDYTETENAMLKNKRVFDEILRDQTALLDPANPREFLFTHSALGVGWDNPNVFNIATLNQSYNDARKRQELGRGLRICRDRLGRRVYDPPDVKPSEEINLLTVVPNETYETFAAQYQAQIAEDLGDPSAGSPLRRRHRGQDSANTVRRRPEVWEGEGFRRFWERLARRTDYVVAFREDEIVRRSIAAINGVVVPPYELQVVRTRVADIQRTAGLVGEYLGEETLALSGQFSPFDLVAEWGAATGLSVGSVLRVFQGLTNLEQILRNPYAFTREAVGILRRIELEEKLRGVSYQPNGELYPLGQFEELVERHVPVQPTPRRGLYDGIFLDSNSAPERDFATRADADPQVLCFLKLPDFYEIPTPFGGYRPDFGLVLHHRAGVTADGQAQEEHFFVIETKGTNDLEAPRALTDDERHKIACAMRHFAAIGIRTVTPLAPQAPPECAALPGPDAYVAPVHQYTRDFKDRV